MMQLIMVLWNPFQHFIFENYLQHIKRMFKGGKLPLVQIVNKVIKESNDNLYVTKNFN